MARQNEPTEDQKARRQQALNKAYGSASQELRDRHREEFNTLYSEHAKALGEEWHPRLTAEQRAAEEFDRLVAEFPFLADRLPTDGPAEAEGDPDVAEAG